MTTTSINPFADAIVSLLDETLSTHHGHYLDTRTSLYETLATISADVASLPVSASCASIAAQVNHVTYYLDVLSKELRGEEIGPVDWNAAWTIGPVTDAEWTTLVQTLQTTADAILALMRNTSSWDEDPAWAAAAIVVHTAYHLGEIRQALCTLQSNRA